MRVQNVIDGIIAKTGVAPLPRDKTCDQLMAGSPDQPVTKIVSSFMATVDVIRKAAEIGADMIITHEPTWFTGKDDTEWLQGDAVYLQKKALLDETGIAIWRFHDYMHFGPEDGIYRGIDEELGWADYRMPADAALPFLHGEHFDGCYQLPQTTLGELVVFLKDKFSMPHMRYIGDPAMPVQRVGFLPGGGSLGLGSEQMPMELMRKRNLDVMLCGEVTEWTLPAYVRDAWQLGLGKAIVVIGHERSEEWGMKHLDAWMASITSDIPVVFVDAVETFRYL